MNQIRHTIHACTASLCAIALPLSLLPTALAVQSPAAPAAKPQRAPGRLDTFDVGGNLGAVIDADGTLWVWGDGGDGVLGPTVDASAYGVHTDTPIPVLDNAAAVTCSGSTHMMAVKTDGSLWSWGDNTQGVVGNGGTTNSVSATGVCVQNAPVRVLTDVVDTNVSGTNAMAVRRDGSVWVWGRSTLTGGTRGDRTANTAG